MVGHQMDSLLAVVILNAITNRCFDESRITKKTVPCRLERVVKIMSKKLTCDWR